MPKRGVTIGAYGCGGCGCWRAGGNYQSGVAQCFGSGSVGMSAGRYHFAASKKRRIGDDQCGSADQPESCTATQEADTLRLDDGSEVDLKQLHKDQVDEVYAALEARAEMPAFIELYKKGI